MHILLATDAWSPQVNGVVRTLQAIGAELEAAGHRLTFLTPQGRRTVPMPFYPEIPLSLVSARMISEELASAAPDAVHIATEGPLGWAVRRACLSRGIPFTTSFHTRFADYVQARIAVPGAGAAAWAILRRFHGPSRAVMVPTPAIARDLERRGFGNVRVWTRGVDPGLFRSYPAMRPDGAEPVLLYAGRLAIEKGVEDFLRLKIPGAKVLVGDGPERARLERLFPDATFLGFRTGEAYARILAGADVLVFPSRSDTFGLVMIEAMACGTPVAAYRVASPVDVVEDGVTGCLRDDLAAAVHAALQLDRQTVQQGSGKFRWAKAAALFTSWLEPIDPLAWKPQAPEGAFIHLR